MYLFPSGNKYSGLNLNKKIKIYSAGKFYKWEQIKKKCIATVFLVGRKQLRIQKEFKEKKKECYVSQKCILE